MLLSRSKSLRFRSSNKQTARDTDSPVVHPLDRFRTPSPSARVGITTTIEAISKHAMNTEENARPKTSGGLGKGSSKTNTARPLHIPIVTEVEKANTRPVFINPGSGTVIYTAEVHSDNKARKLLDAPSRESSRNPSPSPRLSAIRDPKASPLVNYSPAYSPASNNTFPMSRSPNPDSMRTESPKPPRLSRWKSMGGMFAKKPRISHEPLYQPLDQNQNLPVLSVSQSPRFLTTPSGWQDEATRKPSPSPKSPRRAFTLPVRPGGSVDGRPKGKATLTKQPLENRILDVEIPKVEMERYSVMFGSLLKPTQPTQAPGLLERRRGSRDRINPLRANPLTPLDITPRSQPQRGATYPPSPAPSPSHPPSLILDSGSSGYRSSDTHHSILHRGKPLHRSHTAPGFLTPSRARFAEVKTPESASFENESITPYVGTPYSRNSFGANDEAAFAGEEPWKPILDEPEWEIINPKTKQERERSFSEEADDVVDAAQPVISVARSMSVTRTRRSRPNPGANTDMVKSLTVRPLVPKIVELKNRKSHIVTIETA